MRSSLRTTKLPKRRVVWQNETKLNQVRYFAAKSPANHNRGETFLFGENTNKQPQQPQPQGQPLPPPRPPTTTLTVPLRRPKRNSWQVPPRRDPAFDNSTVTKEAAEAEAEAEAVAAAETATAATITALQKKIESLQREMQYKLQKQLEKKDQEIIILVSTAAQAETVAASKVQELKNELKQLKEHHQFGGQDQIKQNAAAAAAATTINNLQKKNENLQRELNYKLQQQQQQQQQMKTMYEKQINALKLSAAQAKATAVANKQDNAELQQEKQAQQKYVIAQQKLLSKKEHEFKINTEQFEKYVQAQQKLINKKEREMISQKQAQKQQISQIEKEFQQQQDTQQKFIVAQQTILLKKESEYKTLVQQSNNMKLSYEQKCNALQLTFQETKKTMSKMSMKYERERVQHKQEIKSMQNQINDFENILALQSRNERSTPPGPPALPKRHNFTVPSPKARLDNKNEVEEPPLPKRHTQHRRQVRRSLTVPLPERPVESSTSPKRIASFGSSNGDKEEKNNETLNASAGVFLDTAPSRPLPTLPTHGRDPSDGPLFREIMGEGNNILKPPPRPPRKTLLTKKMSVKGMEMFQDAVRV
jgi:hypothetical protein